MEDLKRYRQYTTNKVRALLRVIRNKGNHFYDLPQPLQNVFVSFPEGIFHFLSSCL